MKRDIAIKTTDGQIYYKRIASVSTPSPGVERLTITPLGTSYAIEEVQMISFLHPSRLDGDGVEITWDTHEFARLSFNTRVIPQ